LAVKQAGGTNITTLYGGFKNSLYLLLRGMRSIPDIAAAFEEGGLKSLQIEQ
jgi:hypothetical protein